MHMQCIQFNSNMPCLVCCNLISKYLLQIKVVKQCDQLIFKIKCIQLLLTEPKILFLVGHPKVFPGDVILNDIFFFICSLIQIILQNMSQVFVYGRGRLTALPFRHYYASLKITFK